MFRPTTLDLVSMTLKFAGGEVGGGPRLPVENEIHRCIAIEDHAQEPEVNSRVAYFRGSESSRADRFAGRQAAMFSGRTDFGTRPPMSADPPAMHSEPVSHHATGRVRTIQFRRRDS